MSIILQEIQYGFRYLLETNSFIDIFLKVDQQYFAAHRCLLSSVSSYFRNLLTEQSYVGFDALPISHTIEGLIAEEVDLFLACLYGSLSVEDAAKMDKLDTLQKAAQALQCPSVIEACQNLSILLKEEADSRMNSLKHSIKSEDMLVQTSNSTSTVGLMQWLDDDNIAAYEVTEYDPSVDDDLVCHTETDSLGPETVNDNDSQTTSIDLQSRINFECAQTSGINLDNSEVVLNLPQDAIRIINDHRSEDTVSPEPIVAVSQGLSKEFLSGIVCLCGRGRSGQTSACHQVPAADRNMRLYACRCPCFRAGLPCNDNCRCKGCRNPHGLSPRMFPPMMKRSKVQKVCYCGYKNSQAYQANSQAKLCVDTAKCLCARSGRSCCSTCRCRCCANPHGQRTRQGSMKGSSRESPTVPPSLPAPQEETDLNSSTSTEAASSMRQCCRCPSLDILKRSEKFTSGIYCSQPRSERELYQKLAIPVKCQCLARSRACLSGCICRRVESNEKQRDVRRRASDIPIADDPRQSMIEKWSNHSPVQRNSTTVAIKRPTHGGELLSNSKS